MINIKKQNFKNSLIFLAALLVILSCQNHFEAQLYPEGKGSFLLRISDNASRTIIPEEIKDLVVGNFTSYRLEFFQAGTTTNPEVFNRINSNLSSPIELDAGIWSLRVSGYITGITEPVAQGWLFDIVINAGQTTVGGLVTLTPIAVGEGEGTFKWQIEFPAGISNASMTITPLNENGTPEETYFFMGGLPEVALDDSLDLNTGYYRVVFKQGNEQIWSEILQIYDGMESNFIFTFVTYTVSFSSNGGSSVPTQTVRKGETVIYPPRPVRNGFNFTGWYTNSELTLSYNFDDKVTENISLFAGWQQAGEEGIYIGIIRFAGEAHDMNNNTLTRLNASGRNTLNNILDGFERDTDQSTVLYYAVHKAMANLTSNQFRFPENIDTINIITFTDGLEQGSDYQSLMNPIEDKSFDSDSEYLAFVSSEILNRKIGNNQEITAYSVGVKGSDVTNVAKFESDLADIASPGLSFSLKDFDEVQGIFDNIANNLNTTHITNRFIMVTPTWTPNTRVRMTFYGSGGLDSDDPPNPVKAATAEHYIEGTINRTGSGAGINYSLVDIISSPGITFNEGAGPINGTISGTSVHFTFNNIIGYIPDNNVEVESELTLQWRIRPGESEWEKNSEYRVTGSSESSIERRSAIIYLVLDNSRSLSLDEVNSIRQFSKNFINTLYDQYFGLLTAPTGINATATSASSITVSWNNVASASGYRVYRSTSATGTYTLVGTISSGATTTFTNTGLSAASTTYFYRVTATNAEGESSQSATVSAMTAAFSVTATITSGGSMHYGTLSGAVGTTQYIRVSLPNAGTTYRIYWNDSDNQSSTNFTDIEVGLIRESTGQFVQNFVDNSSTNRFTYTIPSGAGGNYLIAIRKIYRATSALYDVGAMIN
ncbi:MAG: InlB B-repeat-containing protein [Treponema sp.]|nr:InlB B-repeat-containing protein [Treponema sp.]